MILLGKSTGMAAVVVAAIGLAVVPASAQIAPAGLAPTTPPPATAKPPGPAGQPATPAAAKPTAPAAAGAQPAAKPADPKALAAAGEKKLKAGDHAGAILDLEAANAAKPSADVDRLLGRAYEGAARYPEAAAAYERFLAASPKSKEQVDEAKKRVEAIRAMPGKIHVEASPAGITAVLVVDPPPPGGTGPAPTPKPLPTDLEVTPGRHTLKVEAEGYEPAERELEIAFGTKEEVRFEMTKTAAAPTPPPPVVAEPAQAAPSGPVTPAPEPRSKVPAFVTGAVAIVAAGVGTAFGIKALSQSSDFDKNPTTKTADDGENNALVADMMFGIAITFGVTSAVLFLSSDTPQSAMAAKTRSVAQPSPRKITVTPTPYVTSNGGGAGALVRF